MPVTSKASASKPVQSSTNISNSWYRFWSWSLCWTNHFMHQKQKIARFI